MHFGGTIYHGSLLFSQFKSVNLKFGWLVCSSFILYFKNAPRVNITIKGHRVKGWEAGVGGGGIKDDDTTLIQPN